jgi:hypothetical protein
MPNWCYNTLTIHAEPATLAQIRAQLSAPYETMNLNFQTNLFEKQVVEQPLSFWNIIKPTDLDAYHDNPVTHDQSGRDHWYNWNCRNWGTKWDASNPYENEEFTEGDDLTWYRFDTPWGIPNAAMLELSRQYPTVTFELEFEEETGWGGTHIYTNGCEEETEEYENKCGDCSELNTLDYCEECGEDLCSKCNNIDDADKDAMSNCEEHKHLLKEETNG